MRHSLVLVAVTTALAVAAPLDAQCRRVGDTRICFERGDRADGGVGLLSGDMAFGVRGGYDFDEETGTAGAQLRLPLVEFLALEPSFDVFFDDESEPGPATDWQGSVDLLVRPRELGGLYGGAGVAFLRRTASEGDEEIHDTDTGWNLLVGLDAGSVAGTRLRPFVEGRWTEVDDYRPFRLVLGVNVPVDG